MPYTKMEEVNPAIRGIKPSLTLKQMNLVASWADAMEAAEDGPESPWAAAIAQFKKLYTAKDDKWVKKGSKALDNCLKAISIEGDEMRVANHIILFGGRDLEGLASDKVNEDGSLGEYFTAETKFKSAFTDTGRLLVDWEHGLTKGKMDGDDLPAPGRDDILGYVDWKTAKVTERGLWVEQVLNLRNKYMGFLQHLIKAGKIGTSAESTSEGVEKTADGQIIAFPLRRNTLTVKPMEWRMMTDNPLLAKAITGLLELSEVEPEPATPEGGGNPPAETDEGPTEAQTPLQVGQIHAARLAAIKTAIEIGLLELEIMEV